MQIFEFHFNPKAKSDLVFDSFCYTPVNIYEKRLGGLYMMGLLKSVLPQNVRFLDNLAKTIKERYYKTISASAEKSLKDALKKANESLEKITKAGDVSWLGNLSFAVVSLKDYELNFTKVADLKILLLRKGQIIDIDQKLRFEDVEPYPLKVFGNIVSGKLIEDDVILILTKDVADAFLKEGVLNELAETDTPKMLKEILNGKKEKLSEISGICLSLFLTKETAAKETNTFLRKKTLKIFSFGKVFSPLTKIFKLPKISLKPKIALNLKLPRIRFGLPKINFKIKTKVFSPNKKIFPVFVLILFLVLGFFIFQITEKRQLKIYQEKVDQIQEKVSQADSFLIIKGSKQAEKKAAALLEEGWKNIAPLVNMEANFPPALSSQVLNLKNTISESLYKINKLVKVQDPELVFEFKAKEFIPQDLISFKDGVFAFSPYSENAFEIDQKNEGRILSINEKINSAIASNDSVLFFAKPDQLINFKDGQFQAPITLKLPYQEFKPGNLSSFQLNLYFSDKENGKITKYPYRGNFQWGEPQLWMENKNIADFKSMAVDGSLWALTKENAGEEGKPSSSPTVIERYYAGKLQEALKLEIFPFPKSFFKIFTSSQQPYIYILEPVQNRIVIINKSGGIIEQFQSEKFDNLLDFSISQDGKTIYLLNGLKVYKITL